MEGKERNEEPDWARWLPPRPLPERFDGAADDERHGREQKAGQVWASCWESGGHVSARVWRVDADGGSRGKVLACSGRYSGSKPHEFNMTGCYRTSCAVLVQDVGQAEPTPPEVLYGLSPSEGGNGGGVKVGDRYATKFDPFTVLRYESETHWTVKWDDGVTITSTGPDTFAEYCEEFEAVPVAPPAVPAETKGEPPARCKDRHAGYGLPCKLPVGHGGEHENGEARWRGVERVELKPFRAPLATSVCQEHGRTCDRPRAEGSRYCEKAVSERTEDRDRARRTEQAKRAPHLPGYAQSHSLTAGGVWSLREECRPLLGGEDK